MSKFQVKFCNTDCFREIGPRGRPPTPKGSICAWFLPFFLYILHFWKNLLNLVYIHQPRIRGLAPQIHQPRNLTEDGPHKFINQKNLQGGPPHKFILQINLPGGGPSYKFINQKSLPGGPQIHQQKELGGGLPHKFNYQKNLYGGPPPLPQ